MRSVTGGKAFASLLIVAAVALACLAAAAPRRGFSAQGYALLRGGGIPVIIDGRLQSFNPYGRAGLQYHERIINSSMQRPPPIPGQVAYPGRPGTIVLATSASIDKYYLQDLGLKFQYVVITSKDLIPYLYPLAVLHAAQGMNVLITTVSWVKAEFSAPTTPKSIRLFARFAHSDLGADYLLLGGDVNVVPTAYWYAQQILKRFGEGPYKATDQYYAFLDGTWDPNHNGKLLECLNESGGRGILLRVLEPLPDAVPDLYVGRLPASNASQMRELVNAEIRYLTSPPAGAWMRRAYLLAGLANLKHEFNASIPKVDMATVAQYVMKDFLKPAGFKVVRAYEDMNLSRTSYPHELNLSRAVADELFRNGSLLILSADHGNQLEQGMPVWVNDSNGDGIPDDHEVKFVAYLRVGDNLSNGGRRPAVYLEGCLMGFYDYTRDSLSEYMLRHAAVAVVASSRTSYYQVPWPGPGGWLDQELAYLFWKALAGPANWTVGPALELSKYYYIKEHGGDPALLTYTSLKDILNYNLLGDPALRVWHPPPKELRVRLNATAVLPGGGVEVSVVGAGGSGVPRALVALYGNASEGLLTYAYTNASGEAVLKVPASASGVIYVAVSKPGFNYGLRTLQAVNITRPVISIKEPAPGYYRGSVHVLVRVYDPILPITKVELLLKGAQGERVIPWNASESHEVLVNTTLRINVSGKYTLVVKAEDSRGRVSTASVLFIVDTQPPEVTIAGVGNRTYLNRGEVAVVINASSISPITYLSVELDGVVLKHEVDVGLNTTIKLTLSGLKQGVHTLTVRVGNEVGLSRTYFVTFTVDLTPPTIRIYPNVSGEFVNPDRVGRLIVVCNDNYVVKHVTVYLDGEAVYSGPWGKLKEVSLNGLKDGRHNVTVEAVDGAGNIGRKTITFYTDARPPSIKLSGVVNGTYVNEREVIVSASVSDDLWVRSVVAYVNNEPVRHYLMRPFPNAPLNRGPVTLVIPVNASVNGRYVVRVVATDAAGNNASAELIFAADHTPPKLLVAGPANGSVLNSTAVVFKVNATDNECLLKVYAVVNGSVEELGKGGGLLRVPTRANGRYVIRLYAVDCAGNKVSLAEVVTADHAPPSVKVLRPLPGERCRTPVNLVASVSDNVGVRRVTVFVDGRVVGTETLAGRGGVVRLGVGGLGNGPHAIVVRAVDAAGNAGEAGVKVFVDNSPPKLTLLNASQTRLLVRPKYLRLLVESNESLSSLRAFVNGVAVKAGNVTSRVWSIVIPGSVLRYGSNEVYITCRDLAGNSASLTTYVTLVKPVVKHTLSRSSARWPALASRPVPAWALLAAVAAAVAVTCAACLARRRGGR